MSLFLLNIKLTMNLFVSFSTKSFFFLCCCFVLKFIFHSKNDCLLNKSINCMANLLTTFLLCINNIIFYYCYYYWFYKSIESFFLSSFFFSTMMSVGYYIKKGEWNEMEISFHYSFFFLLSLFTSSFFSSTILLCPLVFFFLQINEWTFVFICFFLNL